MARSSSSKLDHIVRMSVRGWMSASQVAGLLDVHPSTVIRMIHNNQVQAIRVGGHWRIYTDEVERVLQEGNAA